MINPSKRFLYSFNNITRLNGSITYINTGPGMEEFFHLTINNLSNTNLIAFSVISMGPSIMGHFLEYLDVSCFLVLKISLIYQNTKNTLSLKITTHLGCGLPQMRRSLLGSSAPVKLFFICPGILPYDLETVRLLIEFTLDGITLNG